MVISINSQSKEEDFNLLLKSTVNQLNFLAEINPQTIQKLKGNKLEPYVRDLMSELAIGTEFENTIELIGGQRFPDIIANKFYGIEVKTTTQNHWKTTGNSVLESTRVKKVERIYILFGKLANPIEFKSREYEHCLSEVVVTHSPRYLIDMNLDEGKTIFDKINTPYEKLRKKKNPIKPITNYYKSKLKPGQELWWINDDGSKSSNIIIDIWSNLSFQRKKEIKCKAMAYFPEIFSNRSDKFGRLALWLVTQESVVCPNLRDLFTAGGQQNYQIGSQTYNNMPKIFVNLFEELPMVIEFLLRKSPVELSEFWKIKTSENEKINHWINQVVFHSKTIEKTNQWDLKSMILFLIK